MATRTTSSASRKAAAAEREQRYQQAIRSAMADNSRCLAAYHNACDTPYEAQAQSEYELAYSRFLRLTEGSSIVPYSAPHSFH